MTGVEAYEIAAQAHRLCDTAGALKRAIDAVDRVDGIDDLDPQRVQREAAEHLATSMLSKAEQLRRLLAENRRNRLTGRLLS